ncbi:MAG: isopentenyl-diphosphate Delta-isomerase [Cyclobacteriaceae bacterium]|nr:MAG: isopentenyl-diphosphate Delta-isomerase [Cyclobacteriaceae bacterium]
MEHVILVDEHDRAIGTMEKMEAHQKGVLHRAFSVLLFNSKGELLIQKRSAGKYHSAGLWTNTCCSHPRPEETLSDAATRRLQEEMGIKVDVELLYTFIYKVNLDGGLIEHELDHVLIGHFEGEPELNRNEASDWRYASIAQLKHEMQENPGEFTHWFKLILSHPEINALIPVQS